MSVTRNQSKMLKFSQNLAVKCTKLERLQGELPRFDTEFVVHGKALRLKIPQRIYIICTDNRSLLKKKRPEII